MFQKAAKRRIDRTKNSQVRKVASLLAQALSLAPDSPEVWDTKSWVLINLRRYEEALKASEKALSLAPVPEALQNKGVALDRLGRREQAVEWLCRAWRAREWLPDKGGLMAETLGELGHRVEECG
jgi:tetratricopeptide (TPR) repeat protein